MKIVQVRIFFWSVFSRSRIEYGDMWSKSPYSARVQENTDQKKLHISTLFTQWIQGKSAFNYNCYQQDVLMIFRLKFQVNWVFQESFCDKYKDTAAKTFPILFFNFVFITSSFQMNTAFLLHFHYIHSFLLCFWECHQTFYCIISLYL